VLTDPPPGTATRAKFLESDRLTTLDLPENGNLVEIARSIESAMVEGNAARVRKSCLDLLTGMASFYAVPQGFVFSRRAPCGFANAGPANCSETTAPIPC
jgi:hypothetical protein